eukprot:11480-Pelagococcus_subviridis.AAC.3
MGCDRGVVSASRRAAAAGGGSAFVTRRRSTAFGVARASRLPSRSLKVHGTRHSSARFGRAFDLYTYGSSAGESTSYSARRALDAQYPTDSPTSSLAATHRASTVLTRPSNSLVTNAYGDPAGTPFATNSSPRRREPVYDAACISLMLTTVSNDPSCPTFGTFPPIVGFDGSNTSINTIASESHRDATNAFVPLTAIAYAPFSMS